MDNSTFFLEYFLSYSGDYRTGCPGFDPHSRFSVGGPLLQLRSRMRVGPTYEAGSRCVSVVSVVLAGKREGAVRVCAARCHGDCRVAGDSDGYVSDSGRGRGSGRRVHRHKLPLRSVHKLFH
jgi:hypothetical protein